jgi:hypothetical protein
VDTLVSVSSSQLSVVPGIPVTFTATIADVAPGTGAPTGTVNFYDNGTLIGTATITAGIATIKWSSLVVGSHSIYAVYNGDANHRSEFSSAITQMIA